MIGGHRARGWCRGGTSATGSAGGHGQVPASAGFCPSAHVHTASRPARAATLPQVTGIPPSDQLTRTAADRRPPLGARDIYRHQARDPERFRRTSTRPPSS